MKKFNNNEQKANTLKEMQYLVDCFTDKLKVLDALDDDRACSGCADLNDQLTTLWKLKTDLIACLHRSLDVVPNDLEMHERLANDLGVPVVLC